MTDPFTAKPETRTEGETVEPSSDRTETPVERAPLPDDGWPYIRCGCGFEVRGESEYQNYRALEDHPCTFGRDVDSDEYDGSRPWYSWIFSFYGVIVVGLIVAAVVSIWGKP